VLLQGLADRVIHTYAPGRVCQLELQPDIPAFVADREYLQIALTQFLSNAFKFSADHQPIVLGAQAENGELHFWVRDFGRGIPPDQLGSIWEIFFQINRDQHEDQGTGSGLAIARGIARLHHGRVQVDSRVHEGSTFSLILPLNRSNA
jgi:signal transduction histidine kinase